MLFGRGPYRRVLRYLPRYRTALIAGALSVLLSRLLLVWAPLLLRRALVILEDVGAAVEARDDVLSQVNGALLAFLGVGIAAGVFTYLQRLLLIGASRRVERDLKRDLFAHVERLPVAAFDRMRTGDLLSRLTSDVEAVRFSVGPGVMYVGSTAVLFPVAVASMIRLSLPVALVALVPLLAIMGVVRIVAPRIMKRTRAVQDRVGDLAARAQESFAGARVVRAYATEDIEVAAFERENQALVRETLGLARQRAVLNGSLYGLGGLAQLAVLVYGGSLAMSGDLLVADLVAFLAYVGMLVWPMISVGWVVSALQRSAAAIQRIDEVMCRDPEQAVTTRPEVEPGGFRGGLRASDLTFSYPGASHTALDGVSLAVEPGETLALVGPVGSGKSTLLALLARIYEPPPDTVFLDDVDVTRIPLERLREAFAAVPQDAFLFSDTIHDNLAYAVEGALSRERALQAATSAGLDKDLAAFPRGLDTYVGERGVTLSGGEKQRTTLARALLRTAPVLLLDDALSSVDTETEARILDRLETEIGRRTTVIVAHRLSTVRSADHIVVLDAGRVIESGTHEALLEAKGWYARTYATQRLEAALEDPS